MIMQASDNFKIWNKGLPLDRALPFLSHTDKVQRLRRLELLCSDGACIRRLKRRSEAPSIASLNSPDLGGPTEERDELRRILKHRFLYFLQNDYFVGYGFTAPQLPESVPVKVPNHLWSGDIDWKKSSVERSGLKMVDIKVFEDLDFGTASPSNVGGNQPGGRPGVALLVETAVLELADIGEIDIWKPYTQSYEPIRKWLAAKNFDNKAIQKGLSDKALEKHANPAIKSLRVSAQNL